jgi:hypothetical protein
MERRETAILAGLGIPDPYAIPRALCGAAPATAAPRARRSRRSA